MNIMVNFFKTILLMPKPWVVWVALLMTVNMAVPIFFIHQLEAQVVLATMIASAALMMAIFQHKGFVRLLGLGHVLWIPMIFWLSERIDFASVPTWFDQWILSVIVLNGLSLLIDGVDVIHYAKGDRAPTLTLDR